MLSVDDLISDCKVTICASKWIPKSPRLCESSEKDSFDVDRELRVYILATVIYWFNVVIKLKVHTYLRLLD